MALKDFLQLGLASLAFLIGCATSAPQGPKGELMAKPVSQEILTSIPFVLHDNRMLVEVFLNGQGPFVMVFETGGVNTLTPEVKKILDLKSQGADYAGGADEKHVPMGSVHLKSMQVGEFKLPDQNLEWSI